MNHAVRPPEHPTCRWRPVLMVALLVLLPVMTGCRRPNADQEKRDAYLYVTTQYLPSAFFPRDRVTFSPFAPEDITVDGNRYRVQGWADSLTRWGTHRRRSYACTVCKTDAGQWEQVETGIADSE